MHEHGGGEFLDVEWEGPGIGRSEIPGAILSHRPLFMTPNVAEFTLDDQRARAGAKQFTSLGCANCHEPERAEFAAPNFEKLSPSSAKSCLAARPAAAPWPRLIIISRVAC